jgi:hypothetical protein
VEVVTAMDHLLAQRFDIAPEDVTLAWLVQTRTDVQALLEQNARLCAELERQSRPSVTMTFTDKSAALAAVELAFEECASRS